MRASHIWLLIALFWTTDAILAACRKHWAAAIPASIAALVFCVVWFVYLRRERVR